MERAGHVAEFSAVWRVVVGVLPRSPCLLNLPESVEVGGRVCCGFPFPAMKRTGLVKEGRGVEPWLGLVVAAVAALSSVAAEAFGLALCVPIAVDPGGGRALPPGGAFSQIAHSAVRAGSFSSSKFRARPWTVGFKRDLIRCWR